jgi:glycogen debranching enzyme
LDDIIRVQDQFYILATSSRADDRTRVLKHGDTFAVFDQYGDILPFGLGEQGLYHDGTRYLSFLDLRLGGSRPLLLSSTVKEDNDILAVDLTNPDITRDGVVTLPRGTLHVFRSKFLWQGSCYEEIRVSNYGLVPAEVSLTLQFDGDFCDIFEVRGVKRARRGTRLPAQVDDAGVALSYQGLDGVIRRTTIEYTPPPHAITQESVRFDLALAPHASATVLATICCNCDRTPRVRLSHGTALGAATRAFGEGKTGGCDIQTSNDLFNNWIERSRTDLHMMLTETPFGPYPYAGVPWFSSPFGRDGVITAMELLWIDPGTARGVLGYLAATQATEVIPEQDAEPGRILHEARGGEMAALGEVPFGRYYGSVDVTPLFVMLAAAYYERTGDAPFIESIWPNVERALDWMERYGDVDGDGFVEYARRSPKGLVQQGWKDSQDSVFHEDGSLADGPIALCEVQGYAYAAYRGAAELATVVGRAPRAEELGRRAETLRERFEDAFWCEDLGTYALALDGGKRPCRVRTSNPGHCLFAGITADARARGIAHTLFGDDMFTGWGIRTVASSELRYNPMSYHNGSVWPHDNALIAAGLGRWYALKDLVPKLLAVFFEASLFFDLHRLPELFCGVARRHGEGPTLYPVACAPQSWAAGAVFMMLQASLGLTLRTRSPQLRFFHPLLPSFLEVVELKNLRVGDAVIDVLLERAAHDVGITVRPRESVEVLVLK